ncbi:beta-1,3-galactosyltransferase 1-like isoform X1 [Neolamprologus brichardi]|uniref:beta-1,3-galactosyltransferase 1-like isoform X1 n=1 Tax=Neolamprologus brichardi TaxID=32507 RepID=UPI001643A36B|nr:beta-1,3-galactosyltransferase 1-like isoform X1 [Neolamprologus brichardi]
MLQNKKKSFRSCLVPKLIPEIVLHLLKMPENTVCKGERTLWIKFRRCLWYVVALIMVGTLVIYSSIFQGSWSLNPRTSTPNSSTSHDSVPPLVDEYTVAYPHEYHFILDELNRCREESPFLVLMIPVAPHNREARHMIRSTWGNVTTVQGKVVSHYFILGQSREENGAETIEEHLLRESRDHRDILQSDFLDSYHNLTIKTMLMFEWLSTHCPQTSYAMKVDSDTFLNVHHLVGMLLKAPQHLYMTGNVIRFASVLRDQNSKWFMPFSTFPESVYPPYAIGLGYVFSLDLTMKILEAAQHVRALYIEDVYVGLCMRHLGITLTDPPRNDMFRIWMPSDTGNCYWTSVITTLLHSSNQLLDVWKSYQIQAQSGC